MRSTMSSNEITFIDFLKLLNQRKKSSALIFLGTVILFYTLTVLLPKKYKSVAVINVYSSYFKNPMVRDVIPELHAQDEIRYNVSAIIKQSYNDEFIDKIANNFDLYTDPTNSSQTSYERNELRKTSFEILSIGPQTYQISFSGGNAKLVNQINSLAIAHIKERLVENRRKALDDLMEALKKRIEILNLAMEDTTSPIVSKSSELLKEEVSRLTKSIDALTQQYSEKHPLVQNLKTKRNILNGWITKKEVAGEEDRQIPVLGEKSKQIINNLLEDLLKKYNYLKVVYDVENKKNPDYLSITQNPSLPNSPVWPKKILFITSGLVIGFILALMNTLIGQFLSRNDENLKNRIQLTLGVPFLGTFPELDTMKLDESSKEEGKNEVRSPTKWN